MLGTSALTERGPTRSQMDAVGALWAQRGAHIQSFLHAFSKHCLSQECSCDTNRDLCCPLCCSNLTGRFVLFQRRYHMAAPTTSICGRGTRFRGRF